MNSSQKIAQYLTEARATEHALVRVLQSQIAMTPTGSYRSALEKHLDETRRHAERVGRRLSELDTGTNPAAVVLGFWEDMIGQALAFGKTPLDLFRGTGGEEKVLKNAKDTCATEALEIATYTAIERLARSWATMKTADLAASSSKRSGCSRAPARDPEARPMRSPGPSSKTIPSYEVTETGAADAIRAAGEATESAARGDGARPAGGASGAQGARRR